MSASEEVHFKYSKKFDTYAVAKCIQIVLDPEIPTTGVNDYEDYLYIRQTALIDKDLHQLLVEMTAEDNNHPKKPHLLTKDEIDKKLPLLRTRPPMYDVHARLVKITDGIKSRALTGVFMATPPLLKSESVSQNVPDAKYDPSRLRLTRAKFFVEFVSQVTYAASSGQAKNDQLSERETLNLFDQLSRELRIAILTQFQPIDLEEYVFALSDRYRRIYNGEMVLVDEIRDADVVFEHWTYFVVVHFGVSYDPERCAGNNLAEREAVANALRLAIPSTNALNAYLASAFRRLYQALTKSSKNLITTIQTFANLDLYPNGIKLFVLLHLFITPQWAKQFNGDGVARGGWSVSRPVAP